MSSSRGGLKPVIGDNEMLIGGRILKVKHKKGGSKEQSLKNQKAIKKALDDVSKGRKALKNGRHLCSCDGIDHKVLSNCLNCGKIVCEQEGYGKCFHCGANVQPQSDTLTQKQREEVGLVQAIHRRNRLLDFDRQFAQRTMVIDDQVADLVFGGADKNHWLTEEEKLEVKQQEKKINELNEKYSSRSNRILKYKFDFAGRRIVEDTTEEEDDKEELKKLIRDIKVSQSGVRAEKPATKTIEDYMQNVKTVIAPSMIHPSVANSGKLKYLEKKEKKEKKAAEKKLKIEEAAKRRSTIQDEIYEDDSDQHIYDKGYIMSMHQPWASLLVYGIKKHEGRSWSHTHRGRLWIASTATDANDELISELENFYKEEPFYRTKENGYQYPKTYPTGCVLGCVDVEDILPQEEYAQRFTDESEKESDSDYVFICTNFKRLLVPFPVSGKPKIYKLDKQDLQRCQDGLMQ